MSKSIEILPVFSFYDYISEEYDNSMNSDSNLKLRKIVKEEFNKLIPRGNIIDFGGGTGLDLPWLLENKEYNIFFLEPSIHMRFKAQKNHLYNHASNNLIFLENDTDINQWKEGSLPIIEKIDGILANFAVLNCIENINVFFEKTSLICNKGSYIIALVLDSRIHVVIKEYPIKTKIAALLGSPMVLYNNHKGKGHTTYIHRLKEYKVASEKYFNFISYTPVGISNFALITFLRNEVIYD